MTSPSRRRRIVAGLAAALLVAAGCSGDDDDVRADDETTTTRRATTSTEEATTTDKATTSSSTTTTEATTTTADDATTTAPETAPPPPTAAPTTPAPTAAPAPPPPGPRPLGEVALRVRRVAGFSSPVVFRTHPNGAAFIGEKGGRIRDFGSGATVLDLRGRVSGGNEQGLLGMAFDRGGDRLYVSYTATDGASVIDEYAFAGGRATGDPRRLLRVAQPAANHNGGDIHLGPDGFLYVALGDGGGAGDPGNNGQRPSTLLGSILRIDPTRPSGNRAYGIPGDNPFVSGGGAPEVYLYGVRNPWRISFDPQLGDLWVADVGQNRWEEITVLPAANGRGRGANLGWNRLEGTHRYSGSPPAGAVGPVYEYSHASGGCSITGGFVYRGDAIPGLRGAYLFADYCAGSLRAIRTFGNALVEHRDFGIGLGNPTSFGVTAGGELVVLSANGSVYRIEAA